MNLRLLHIMNDAYAATPHHEARAAAGANFGLLPYERTLGEAQPTKGAV